MGANLSKRLSLLQEQAEQEDGGRVGFLKAVLLFFLIIAGIGHLFSEDPIGAVNSNSAEPIFQFEEPPVAQAPTGNPDGSIEDVLRRLNGEATAPQQDAPRERVTRTQGKSNLHGKALWREQLRLRILDRIEWLETSIIAWFTADWFADLGDTLFSYLVGVQHNAEQGPEGGLLEGITVKITETFVTVTLRLTFILAAFWPLWLIGSIVGWVSVRTILRKKDSTSILGVCHRGDGPFYSGIFGPFRPNESVSGTDYSCPNLACPDKEKKHIAIAHPLVKILRQFGAFNETNLELIRVILAHKDYPAMVLDERPADVDTAVDDVDESGFITNADGTIEQCTREGLHAILEAHRMLKSQFGKNAHSDGQKYKEYLASVGEQSKNLTPLGRLLAESLIPSRARAISAVPATLIASAYLAIEAGKALVYERVQGKFSRISLYPHLQARAVLQSLIAYHRDYKGDGRLIVRQAILCSRRHGDFGRAFLPISMPLPSRALRDWLEILYTRGSQRDGIAQLCELDAHLEEIHVNFRNNFKNRLEKNAKRDRDPGTDTFSLWKGISYKSVVLMPLNNIVEIALTGLSVARLERITELMKSTRKIHAHLSISARLPGFKRQAEEAERDSIDSGSIIEAISQQEGGAKLIDRWFIIRRMLTRYNWLSTRVGDNAVPGDGLIQSILVDRATGGKPEVVGLDSLAPLRQRRFVALLGDKWERGFYSDTPHQNDVEIFINNKTFRERLAIQMERAQRGALDVPAAESATTTVSAES